MLFNGSMDPTNEQKPFYTPEGQVADKKVAEGLAYLEKPARDREAELNRQSETGLTERQKANIELMNGLEEKYPLAFDKIIDDKGRKILAINPVGDQTATWGLGKFLMFTEQGVFTHTDGNTYLDRERLNSTRFLDTISEGGYREGQGGFMVFDKEDVVAEKEAKLFADRMPFLRIDLGDDRVLDAMKIQFEMRQGWKVQLQAKEDAKQAKLDTKIILGKLTS